MVKWEERCRTNPDILPLHCSLIPHPAVTQNSSTGGALRHLPDSTAVATELAAFAVARLCRVKERERGGDIGRERGLDRELSIWIERALFVIKSWRPPCSLLKFSREVTASALTDLNRDPSQVTSASRLLLTVCHCALECGRKGHLSFNSDSIFLFSALQLVL